MAEELLGLKGTGYLRWRYLSVGDGGDGISSNLLAFFLCSRSKQYLCFTRINNSCVIWTVSLIKPVGCCGLPAVQQCSIIKRFYFDFQF